MVRTTLPCLTLVFWVIPLLPKCAAQDLTGTNQSDHTQTKRLITRADSLFCASPKIYENVDQAHRLLRQALDDLEAKDPRRYDASANAALYAIWLALHDKDRSDILKHASEAMSLSLKAISLDKDRVEGSYYRAIATGLFAEQNKAYGRQAMNEIRANGERAITLDPKFDHAGPHRLLGAIYLRAPGPPSGIGVCARPSSIWSRQWWQRPSMQKT